jgi:hypothetical protein
VPKPLPRFSALQKLADAKQIQRIVAAVEEAAAPDAKRVAGASRANLRGLPAIGRNVAGAIAGTSPEQVLMAKGRRLTVDEDRHRRRPLPLS